MYLRKILTDGNKEFMENMRIDFDYQKEHYNVRIKKLADTYFESYDGTCFDYDEIKNCKKGYIVGEEVTVSIKTLYESPVCVEEGWINTEKDENGNIGYYDLYTTSGLVCMDGEICVIIDVKEDCIILKNTDGEVDTEFTLTFDEADICCFECVDD